MQKKDCKPHNNMTYRKIRKFTSGCQYFDSLDSWYIHTPLTQMNNVSIIITEVLGLLQMLWGNQDLNANDLIVRVLESLYWFLFCLLYEFSVGLEFSKCSMNLYQILGALTICQKWVARSTCPQMNSNRSVLPNWECCLLPNCSSMKSTVSLTRDNSQFTCTEVFAFADWLMQPASSDKL